MTTEKDAGPQITGNAPLYRKPEPLNPKDHGKLGLLRHDYPYHIAEGMHFCPLHINEFGAAACSYPVVFAGEEKAPIAIMGLSTGENMFFGAEKRRGEFYVPAYVRRYPFTVANSEDPKEERAIVCIDRESPLIGENPAEPFFDKDGRFTGYTERCVRFCEGFERERLLTQAIIGKLRDLDLFESRTAHFTPTNPDGTQGEPQIVSSFFAISQEKLNALPVEKYIELRDQGVLTAIFAHWISQGHWDRLIGMTIAHRGGVLPPAGAEANGAKPAATKKSDKKVN